MKVSVVIPVYNKSPFVGETISSVLNQTHQDFELIIVDDGSTDGSQEIIKKIDDTRIQFYQNEKNLGTSLIGNKLMDLAKSDYVVRIDADDLMVEDRIVSQIDFMEKNKDIVVSSGNLQCFGQFNDLWSHPQTHEAIWSSILFKCPINQTASIIRMDLWQKYGIKYDEHSPNLGEDWLLWFRLGRVGKLGNLNKVLVNYRVEGQNITGDRKKYYYDSRNFLYNAMFSELGLTNEYVNVHLLTKPEFDGIPQKEDILRYFEWMDILKKFNIENRIFNNELFEAEISNRTNKLFYYLLNFKKRPIRTYIKKNKGLDYNQFKYYLALIVKGK